MGKSYDSSVPEIPIKAKLLGEPYGSRCINNMEGKDRQVKLVEVSSTLVR